LVENRSIDRDHLIMFRRLLFSNPAPAASSPKPSATAIVAETVAGSHVLAVKGFSCIKGLGNGELIGSQIFNVGGCSWIILYYPDGRGSGYADCVSISLQLDKTSAAASNAKARCTFTLLDDDGRPVPSHSFASTGILGFTSKGDPWGIHIKRKVLEKWPYFRDDCLRVRCDVTVYKGIIRKQEEDDSAGRFVYVPPSDAHWHLGRLLEGGEGADVAFDVAGETVAAHRCILAARSPVFMAELFGPMTERTSARVRVDDMDAGAFKAMLHFVYTARCRTRPRRTTAMRRWWPWRRTCSSRRIGTASTGLGSSARTSFAATSTRATSGRYWRWLSSITVTGLRGRASSFSCPETISRRPLPPLGSSICPIAARPFSRSCLQRHLLCYLIDDDFFFGRRE
jgi:speckle-type POZ protein